MVYSFLLLFQFNTFSDKIKNNKFNCSFFNIEYTYFKKLTNKILQYCYLISAMAKKGMIEREKKRQKLVLKYSEKRQIILLAG